MKGDRLTIFPIVSLTSKFLLEELPMNKKSYRKKGK